MSTDDREVDFRCMERLAEGDQAALEELYDRWAKPLLNFLYGMCADRALAEDLMQEVFVKVWRAAPRYRPIAKFSTWLFQIARNHWLNEREKRMRRLSPLSLDSGGRNPDGDRGSLARSVDSGAPTPDTSALRSELGHRIMGAVAALPDKLRSVWVLAVNQGLGYREVADVLEIPVGTVKSRMFQAVRVLRTELAPYVEG